MKQITVDIMAASHSIRDLAMRARNTGRRVVVDTARRTIAFYNGKGDVIVLDREEGDKEIRAAEAKAETLHNVDIVDIIMCEAITWRPIHLESA